MATAVVRIDEAVLAGVKVVAGMRGQAPGEVLAQAWSEFSERHRAEISADFERVAEMMRNGDREGLLEFMRLTRSARAEVAAELASG